MQTMGGRGNRTSFGTVVGENKTRRLQVATGGGYKYLILSKIVYFLKNEYLESREIRPTMEGLLQKVGETDISDKMKNWLADDALPKHPRISVVPSKGRDGQPVDRFAYRAPLKLGNEEGLLFKLLKMKYKHNEGGLLRSLVEDSINPSLADRFIKNLLKDNKIIQINRLDNNRVLFYKPKDPELDKHVADNRFVELWRKVDVGNKEMTHIKMYLENKKITIFNEEPVSDGVGGIKRKAVDEAAAVAPARKIRKRSKIIVKDNVHVEDDLMEFSEEL